MITVRMYINVYVYPKMYIKLYNEMNKIGCISEGNIPLKIVKHTMENIEKNYRI